MPKPLQRFSRTAMDGTDFRRMIALKYWDEQRQCREAASYVSPVSSHRRERESDNASGYMENTLFLLKMVA